MIKIALDSMGADAPLSEIAKGISEASFIAEDLELIIFGPEEELTKELNKLEYNKDAIKIINCTDVVTNNEDPFMALRIKKDASIVKAYKYIKDNNDVEGFVTCGATGAVIVGSIISLEPVILNGEICKPCLAALLPNKDGENFVLLDCGANIDARSEDLFSFGVLGEAFAKSYLGIESPRIGLISNGSEDKKGNALTKSAFKLFKESNKNFVGNIEGTDVVSGKVDVLVCDGFSGNILLKNIEGIAKSIIKDLVKEAKIAKEKNDLNTYNVLNNMVMKLMAKFDFNNLAGATLLGVNKVIIKGHGAATSDTIKNIVKQAYVMIRNNYLGSIYNQ